MRRLVIIGAGGHGKVAAECAAGKGYRSIVFLDDDTKVRNCGKYPVVGTGKEFRRFMAEDEIATDFWFFAKLVELEGYTTLSMVTCHSLHRGSAWI